ncbi:MAG: hypothetical protein K2Q23_07690 [Bryobacteraceae bacterium]|nr:hypothetical protein [Bryobacteraceae bacterium]
MTPDPEYLRRHYASLSDEALHEIDPSDLVASARRIYEEELARREAPAQPLTESARPVSFAEEDDWLEDAAEVYGALVLPGTTPGPQAAAARRALEEAGIPSELEVVDAEGEDERLPPGTKRWRLLVPGRSALHAASVLDRDLFNEQFENEWRTHLEMLTDEQVAAMTPRVVFCGLFDRLERITRVHAEELARRRENR